MSARAVLVAAAIAAHAPLSRALAQGSTGSQGASSPSSGQGLGQTLEGDAARAVGGGQDLSSVLGWLHRSNATAIQGAQLAQQKASATPVKELASKVLADRTSTEAEVQSLAKATGTKLPTGAQASQAPGAQDAQAPGARGSRGGPGTSALDALKGAQGSSFDQRFVQWLGQHAQEDAGQAKAAQADARRSGNGALAGLLGRLVPRLQSHAQSARKLESSLAPGASGTGSGG